MKTQQIPKPTRMKILRKNIIKTRLDNTGNEVIRQDKNVMYKKLEIECQGEEENRIPGGRILPGRSKKRQKEFQSLA